ARTARVRRRIPGVEACLERIAGSPLHDRIRIRAMMRCEDRAFPRWSFGATNVDDRDFKRAANAGHFPDFFALDVLQAERLLGIVASRKRRAVKMDMVSVRQRNFHPTKSPRALNAVVAVAEARAAAAVG
ncbi:MAG: hypothetical protein AAF631_12970, partial [Pseudomonadota bacterium]